MDKHRSQLKQELTAKTRELEKAQKRLADLDKLLQKAFEQLALENLSETQFKALTGNYETERQELTQHSSKLDRKSVWGKTPCSMPADFYQLWASTPIFRS